MKDNDGEADNTYEQRVDAYIVAISEAFGITSVEDIRGLSEADADRLKAQYQLARISALSPPPQAIC